MLVIARSIARARGIVPVDVRKQPTSITYDRSEEVALERSGTGRRARRFAQADLARAIRAAKQEQIEIAEIRIEPDGTILIVPGIPNSMASSGPNPWDE
ncbi:MAG TPA: hypothetical protein EYP98_04655 [Planctomycetes bacterium]|nr:hypothetical protein [Planctomycetota bacterium]